MNDSSVIPCLSTRARIAVALGVEPLRLDPVRRGYTLNRRFVATFGDGTRAFVKEAIDEATAGWLRDEHRVYASVRGAFLPELLGWYDDGELPLLVLEDLSAATWPPPWPARHIDAIRAALDELHAVKAPPGVIPLEDERDQLHGWERVAEDPRPFLSLGVASPEWLVAALPRLVDAARAADLEGDSLIHMDTYAENMCIDGGRGILVDWNWARVGPAVVDFVAWLPSLFADGGPPPWELLPDPPAPLVAGFSGYWASVAGLPAPDYAPEVRPYQRTVVGAALDWAARVLDLPDRRV